MSVEQAHIPDRDLILHLDGELPVLRAFEVRRHLKGCPECSKRCAMLDQTMSGLTAAILASEDLPTAAADRARLREAIANLPPPPSHPHLGRITAVVAIALSLIGAALALKTRQGDRAGLLMPNPVLTPGAALPISREEVCTAREPDDQREVPTALAITVFNHYGIRNPISRSYEVDYLITPALGGAEDIRNLWPQPYATGEWNSRVKDALEDRLRTLVCEGHLELSDAQAELARDWIAAYKRHFQTDAPLDAHRSFVKDRPWE